jgi:prophage tail gpP-like protein
MPFPVTSPAPPPPTKAQSEKATLSVGGQQFEDFETIWVQQTLGDTYHQFKFTCAERKGADQFKPGQKCSVKLANQDAIKDGIILSRQVAYDAYRHGVVIWGVTNTYPAVRSGINHGTHSFDDKDLKAIVDEILKPTGVKCETRGNVDMTKWDYMHCMPGETIHAFVERLARDRNVTFTADKDGKLVLIGQDYDAGNQGQLIEGQNILKMQCEMSKKNAFSKYILDCQTPADNKLNGKAASEQRKSKDGTAEQYSVCKIPMEQPVRTLKEVDKRALTEQMFAATQELQATVTVQGWQPGGAQGRGELWAIGKKVKVTSPMAMLDQQLAIQQVTFTQDNQSGSLTTLVLVQPFKVPDSKGRMSGLPGQSTSSGGGASSGGGTGNLPAVS